MQHVDSSCRAPEAIEEEIIRYVESPTYATDLLTIQQLWKTPGVFGTAGIFIFLSYISVPDLTAVRGSNDRVLLPPVMHFGQDGAPEERFLRRLLGLESDESWGGGLRNPRVRSLTAALQTQHARLAGMQPGFMEFIAGIIAVSALRTLAALGYDLEVETRAGYWRYFQYAMALLGTRPKAEQVCVRDCEAFIDAFARPSAQGQQMVASLVANYAEYVQRAVPVLFPKSRAVVLELLTSGGE